MTHHHRVHVLPPMARQGNRASLRNGTAGRTSHGHKYRTAAVGLHARHCTLGIATDLDRTCNEAQARREGAHVELSAVIPGPLQLEPPPSRPSSSQAQRKPAIEASPAPPPRGSRKTPPAKTTGAPRPTNGPKALTSTRSPTMLPQLFAIDPGAIQRHQASRRPAATRAPSRAS